MAYRKAREPGSSRSEEIIKLLLRHGANPNSPIFLYAAINKDQSIIKLLLENGANIDLQDNTGYTALLLAVLDNSIEIAILLLEHRANPNIQIIFGTTALMMASYKGSEDIVQLLLNYGADPYLRDNNGHTALSVASNQRIKSILERFVFDCNKSDERSYDRMCIICTDEVRDDKHRCKLNCGHFYHKKCIGDIKERLLSQNRLLQCPICGGSFKFSGVKKRRSKKRSKKRRSKTF